MRRGIAELNGEGEVAGGVVILRSGKNAREVISAVKRSWRRCKAACRKVEVVTTYDRSQLIDRAIDNLSYKLLEEFIVVAGLRPVPVARALGAGGDYLATARPVLRLYHDAFPGLNANIMSLGGIAIAVGRWSMPPS